MTDQKRTVCDVRGCRRWKDIKPLDSRYVGTLLRVGPRLCPQHIQDAIDGGGHRRCLGMSNTTGHYTITDSTAWPWGNTA